MFLVRFSAFLLPLVIFLSAAGAAESRRPWIEIRAVYGGFPSELIRDGKTLCDQGINAVFVGSGGITADLVAKARQQGVKLFAEFNTLHGGSFLKRYPDAAPIGADGRVCPAPHGWQGVCPTHPGYRQSRIEDFRKVLETHAIDGIWLDYHHSHASWENADPLMPDTCFCDRCLDQFSRETKTSIPPGSRAEQSAWLLGPQKVRWVQWRCGVFTDWVRQFDEIRKAARPAALLGTFHCPWSEDERDGAIRNKLAIDLKAQSRYLDVLSIMPYHARFGHAADPAWISRQTAELGKYLGIRGEPGERLRIWPIVQLADWGEKVLPEHVAGVLDHGTCRPATGVIVFHWSGLRSQPAKAEAMLGFFRNL